MDSLGQPGLVSIIINCYNGEKYLAKALDSILEQTFCDWELIFWDNQSSDRTAQIVSKYNEGRFKYFLSEKHTYLYEARNRAIDETSGEFLAFLDADDWWDPYKLEKQMPLFNNKEVGLVYGNYWFYDQINEKRRIGIKNNFPKGNVLDSILRKCPVGLLTSVIRRETIQAYSKPCDPRFHIIGDFDLYVRISQKWKFDCVESPVATYRWHGENETLKHDELQLKEWDLWLADIVKNDQITKIPGFKIRKNSINIFKAKVHAQNEDWQQSIKIVGEIVSFRVRLLILFRIIFNWCRHHIGRHRIRSDTH